jgi:hypothetical protein
MCLSVRDRSSPGISRKGADKTVGVEALTVAAFQLSDKRQKLLAQFFDFFGVDRSPWILRAVEYHVAQRS